MQAAEGPAHSARFATLVVAAVFLGIALVYVLGLILTVL